MYLPMQDDLEIGHLSRVFDNKSECYKLFWMQAIVEQVVEGKVRLTFDDTINRMVVHAWYMVTEFRLNLGPRDTLEVLVHLAKEVSGFPSNAKKMDVQRFMERCQDKQVLSKKDTLTKNVPFRFQAPFLPNVKGAQWECGLWKLADRINGQKHLIYYFREINGRDSLIEVTPDWVEYISRNSEILFGWIEYNLICYLQRRNPNVPGISNKLSAPQERKMNQIKKYWRAVIECMPIRDIYSDCVIERQDISIDHFVPWSYVAHDEMWNLHPTTKSINSQKSNSLPDWNMYFQKLCHNEYDSIKLMWEREGLKELFEKCRREHVNSDDAWLTLYEHPESFDTFANGLHDILLPVYQSAKNQGFPVWALR